MTHTGHDSTLNKQIHLLTLNINGLQNDNKRLDLFQQLQNKAIDIIFLQETHTTPDTSTKWEKDWKGKSFWHSGPNPKASGIAILFKENLNFNIISYETDYEIDKMSFRNPKPNFSIDKHLRTNKPQK